MAGGNYNQNNYPPQQGGNAQQNYQQPYGQPAPPPHYPGYAPFPGKQHRGAIVLVLAILSWVACAICGIIAMVMAKNDIKEMEQGLMDPSGMQLTKAAYWVSLVNLIFVGGMILLYAGFIVLMIATDGFR